MAALHKSAVSMVGAAFFFACMGGFVKAASQSGLPMEIVVWGRNFFGILVLIPSFFSPQNTFRTDRLWLHVSRSVFGLSAMYCFFYALHSLPLAEAVLLNYTTPLFTPLIAFWWLGERVRGITRVAVVVGFIGVIFVLKPGLGFLAPAALLGVVSSVLAAFAMVNIRKLSATEPTLRIVFYFNVTCIVISSVPLLWAWQTPTLHQWSILLAAGLCATTGQLLLTRAYANAPAAQVGPFSYSSVIFAATIGWVLWGEVIDGYTLIGGLLIVLAGVMAGRR